MSRSQRNWGELRDVVGEIDMLAALAMEAFDRPGRRGSSDAPLTNSVAVSGGRPREPVARNWATLKRCQSMTFPSSLST
jgi:hypothetical protein